MNKSGKGVVRVRIAPSPTGFAHVGTAYTALFNYAFAKHHNGEFVIRIEDTDRKRHVDEAEKAIHGGLKWLGLTWDESTDKGGKYSPYRQSERLDLYKSRIDELLKKKLAYKDEGAVRFKNPGENVFWNDLIRGKVNFPGSEITDFVIQKSDGYPTYNFAVVVDDIEMKITHVIRGDEHISNTPRQLALYKAIGADPPEFAHHPTLRNKDHKKLSKRRDPVDLGLYQKEGYLPEALVNFLCLLGWSHPDEKEIFDLREFVKLFEIKRVRKAGPIFDTNKLDWMNGQYLQKLTDEEFVKSVKLYASDEATDETLLRIAPLTKDRIKKLSDFKDLAGFFFNKPKIDKKLLGDGWEKHIQVALSSLESIKEWNLDNINKRLMSEVEGNNFKTGNFFMDLRIAITGSKFTPPINESIEILGKFETLSRLKKLITNY